jgi:catechol 2,3-dioxygenase-like lactoylglutathione lyase family enzyme
VTRQIREARDTGTAVALRRRLPDVSGPASPQSLAHIVFRTNDLQRMIDWYGIVLGAHEVFRNDRIAFLTYDDEHHRIALVASAPFAERPEGHTVGFYHAAFTYAELGELLATYRRLAAENILPWRAVNHGPTVSFYYRDPDGNDVELQVDVFPTADEATAWMRGPVYAADPIGPLFEPEDLIARYEAGEPIAHLTRRSDDTG